MAALSALAVDAAARLLPPVNLTEAAVRGDVAAIEDFLDSGTPSEQRSIGFASPLAAAASRGHLEAVKRLVERGANLDPEGCAFPLLAFPIANRKLDVVEFLLKAGAPVSKYRKHFCEAARQKQWDVVDAMIAGGADAGWLSEAQRAQLESFVDRQQPRSAEYRQRLSEEQIRLFESERATQASKPLSEDDRARHEKAACAEIERDPALARLRSDNATPVLALAVSTGALALVRCLLAAGADPDDGGASQSPLSRAAGRSDVAMVTTLLTAGADPNRRRPGSLHPLLAAARAGSLACVEALRLNGGRLRASERKLAIAEVGGPQAQRISALLDDASAARKRGS